MNESDRNTSGIGCLAVSISVLGSIGICLLVIAANTIDNTQRGFSLYPGYLLTGLALLGAIPLAFAIRRNKSQSAKIGEEIGTGSKPTTSPKGRPMRVAVGCAGTLAILCVTAFLLIGLLEVNAGFFLAGVTLVGALTAIIVLWRWQFRVELTHDRKD